MDSIIYDYLIENKNKMNHHDDQHDDQDDDNDNQIFLDCLLILSINKINIDYNTLLHYCNNIIKNSNNNNNNNKRNLEYDQNGGDDIYYGLNNNQFNVLYKIIKSLNVAQHDNNISNIRIHTIIELHLNNNDNISTFDCSILIIIKNNLKLLQQQQSNNSSRNNNMNKRIKLNNNSKSSSSSQQQSQQQQKRNKITRNLGVCSCSCSSGGVDYNYLLFKKVWGNIVIRSEIIFHIRLFNFHKDRMTFTYKQLVDYKYRSYLNSLKLYARDIYNDETDEEEIGTQNNINNKNNTASEQQNKSIPRDIFTTKHHSKYIPSSVERLKLCYFRVIEENSIPNTIKKLKIGGNQKLSSRMFNNIGGIGSDNITRLALFDPFDQSLIDADGKPWLPRNLTSLEFGSSFQQDILPGQLPNSLTSLALNRYYKGTIIPNSIPKSVTTLDYTFNSNNDTTILKDSKIPSSTTNLIFDDRFDQTIEIGDIPHNVTSLTFGELFNSRIKAGSLPQSLQSLQLSGSFNQPIHCDDDDDDGSSILPSNLTSLTFGFMFNQPISNGNNNGQSFFPISITKLHFRTFDKPINNSFNHLINLNDLKICCDTGIGILPNSIKTLDLGYSYQHPLTESLLSLSSLTSLSYWHNDNSIPPNCSLPNSITTLKMYNAVNARTDLPNPLPTNLKSINLSLENNQYDLSLIDWPNSLETIYVNYDNASSLFNKVPTDFFIKYFKPEC